MARTSGVAGMPEQSQQGSYHPLLIAGDPSRFTKGEDSFPRIEMAVGRSYSAGGLVLVSYTLNERGGVVGNRLVSKRWRDKPQSVQECLEIAHRGLRYYMEKAGIPFE